MRPRPGETQVSVGRRGGARRRREDHSARRDDGRAGHLDGRRGEAVADPCRVRVARVSEEEFCACVEEGDSEVARRHNQEARAVSEMMRPIAKTPSTHGFGSYGR